MHAGEHMCNRARDLDANHCGYTEEKPKEACDEASPKKYANVGGAEHRHESRKIPI